MFLGGVLIVVLLFAFGKTTLEKKSETAEMPAAPNAASVEFSFILEKAKGTLRNSMRDSVESMELQLKKARGEKEQAAMLKSMAEEWEQTGNILVAGKYYAQSAMLTNDKALLEKAGDLLYKGFPTTTDSSARIFGAQEGIKVFSELSKMDPENQEYKIHQAVCYVDGLGQVMPGVTLLKEVETKEPDNKEMNLILARLAIVSGQYDKAIQRLEKLTKLDSSNAEVYFHLAEAYRAVGRTDDAIKSLEQCKALVKDPTFSAQIDQYIQKIKNP